MWPMDETLQRHKIKGGNGTRTTTSRIEHNSKSFLCKRAESHYNNGWMAIEQGRADRPLPPPNQFRRGTHLGPLHNPGSIVEANL